MKECLTWGVHDIEEVRFSFGIWQNHCHRSAFDANTSLKVTKREWSSLHSALGACQLLVNYTHVSCSGCDFYLGLKPE